ncbi:MAG: ABC transporter ATP-binding protein, partial [Chitinophagaceae bacterium]
DLERWYARVRGKENPLLHIGETNDRSTKGISDIIWSLKNINFEIEKGNAVGIIGKNGAGKSTLLKVLSRVTSPTTGRIQGSGRIASLLEVGTGFHPELTGRENIYLNGAILGMRKSEITKNFDEIVDFAGVERYIDTPVKRYSSGMYVRLAFAVAAYLESEILIVDEVLAVGDAEFQKKCLGKMGQVSKNQGRTVLFVSHNMGSIRALCSSAMVLANGEKVFDGHTEQAINHYLEQQVASDLTLHAVATKKHRKYLLPKDVEILAVEMINPVIESQFSSKQPLHFEFTLKANRSTENFRLAGSIYNQEGIRLGLFFGQEVLSLAETETKKIKFSIVNHNLSKGIYSLSFSTGRGSVETGNIEFDIVYDILRFEIAYTNDISTPIVKWENDWGNFIFQTATEA